MQRRLIASASVLVLSYSTLAGAQPQPPPPPPPAPPAAQPPAEPPPAEPPVAEPAPEPAPEPTPVPAPEPAPEPAPPPMMAAAPAAPAATALPEAKEEEPAPPSKLKVGSEGLFQPGALLQFWAVRTQKPVPGPDTATSMFRLRRAEIKIKGDIVPKLVSYQLMFDLAKVLEFNQTDVDVQDSSGATIGSAEVDQPQSNVSVLQDFFITFKSDYADVSLGQFKIPLSYEGYNSASKLLFPERALSSRRWGDKRDLGIRVDKTLGDYFYYSFGVFNGAGLNRPDNNHQKDVGLRLEAYPMEGITVGAVGYTSVGERDEPTTKDRVEGDLKVEMHDFLFQGEYIRAWDGPSGSRQKGHGMYGAVGYTIMNRMQPLVRVGYVDPELDGDGTGNNDEIFHYELGFNYYLRKQEAKLMLSYSVFDPEGLKAGNEAIIGAQASF